MAFWDDKFNATVPGVHRRGQTRRAQTAAAPTKKRKHDQNTHDAMPAVLLTGIFQAPE